MCPQKVCLQHFGVKTWHRDSSTPAYLAAADAAFVGSLQAAEGTRLANFSSEKHVFINMHGQPLPLKRAFVAQQMPEHNEEKQIRIKARAQIDGIRSADTERGVWHCGCSSSFILIN